jgi:hypothetical protein
MKHITLHSWKGPKLDPFLLQMDWYIGKKFKVGIGWSSMILTYNNNTHWYKYKMYKLYTLTNK